MRRRREHKVNVKAILVVLESDERKFFLIKKRLRALRKYRTVPCSGRLLIWRDWIGNDAAVVLIDSIAARIRFSNDIVITYPTINNLPCEIVTSLISAWWVFTEGRVNVIYSERFSPSPLLICCCCPFVLSHLFRVGLIVECWDHGQRTALTVVMVIISIIWIVSIFQTPTKLC